MIAVTSVTPSPVAPKSVIIGLLSSLDCKLWLTGVLAELLAAEGLARLSLRGRALADLQQAAELVQEQMHKFMEQIAPHFEGKHHLRRA